MAKLVCVVGSWPRAPPRSRSQQWSTVPRHLRDALTGDREPHGLTERQQLVAPGELDPPTPWDLNGCGPGRAS
jgi:hypothetical protein